MKISPQKKSSQKSFAEFSRQKYSEYKSKHPDLSSNQIGDMIKKQWQSTNKQTRLRGQKSTSSPREEEAAVEEGILSGVKEQIDSAKKQLFPPIENSIKQQEEVKVSKKEQVKQEEASLGRIRGTRKISKRLPQTQFGKFSVFYLDKLQLQHPRWTRVQINKIIQLLWRKKKSTQTKLHQLKVLKPVSGRKLFADIKRKQEKMDAAEIKARWNMLPKQSKIHWAAKGSNKDGHSSPKKKSPMSIGLKPSKNSCMPVFPRSRPLSFMNNTI